MIIKSKVLGIIALGLFVTNTDVTFDESNREYYQKICSTYSSYKLNKEVCDSFEKFQYSNEEKKESIIEDLNESTLNATQLFELLKNLDVQIEQKNTEIEQNKESELANKEKITKLDEDILANFEAMQYLNSNNQIIDVLMSATSFNDLLLRVDSVSNITRANYENIKELEKATTELDEARRYLDEDIRLLQENRVKYDALLVEYRRKEAEIYSTYSSSAQSGIIFNEKILELNLEQLTDKNTTMIKPIQSALVSALPWAYPEGGWHAGIDMATPVGTPILAPMDGAILASGKLGGGYGTHIVTVSKQGNTVYTMLFAHMSEFAGVNGFKQGDIIGYSGNTGMSTGPHLHFEIFKHNTSDIQAVINQYRTTKNYFFGIASNGIGDCNVVCRIKPDEVFGLTLNQRY